MRGKSQGNNKLMLGLPFSVLISFSTLELAENRKEETKKPKVKAEMIDAAK